jgi:hypothetical protein
MHELEPAVLGSFREIRNQTLGAREPASGDGERAAAFVVPAQRQSDSSCPEKVAVGRVGGVRTLPVGDGFLDLSAPPRGLAEALVIVGSQDAGVDIGVRGVGRAPGLLRSGGRASSSASISWDMRVSL